MGLWKENYKEAYSIDLHSILMIGDGSRVKFWEGALCSEELFGELFPMLYALVGSKGASMKEIWRPVEEQGG